MHPDALYFIIYSKADDLLVSGRMLEFIGLNSTLEIPRRLPLLHFAFPSRELMFTSDVIDVKQQISHDVTGGQQFLLAASQPIRIEYGTHLWDKNIYANLQTYYSTSKIMPNYF